MAAAHSRQPVVGGPPGHACFAAPFLPAQTGGRVGAEELHAGQAGVQVAQAVTDHLVIDVAAQVDDEAVIAQPLFRRA